MRRLFEGFPTRKGHGGSVTRPLMGIFGITRFTAPLLDLGAPREAWGELRGAVNRVIPKCPSITTHRNEIEGVNELYVKHWNSHRKDLCTS